MKERKGRERSGKNRADTRFSSAKCCYWITAAKENPDLQGHWQKINLLLTSCKIFILPFQTSAWPKFPEEIFLINA